ncbi:hypothetical protein ABBQ32_012854 [Trebouxia sp. C0010 RCD-2024]
MRNDLPQEPRKGPSASAMPHPDNDGPEAITKSPYQRSAKRQATERSIAPSLVAALPDELLLKVFSELAKLGPVTVPDEEVCHHHRFPFRTFHTPEEPHPGLRSYPFLGQVCRRWQHLLECPGSRQDLYREVVIDFGHELITAVHTPIVWSDRRPTDKEFRESFGATKLSAQKILDFMHQRQSVIQKVVLTNSEGYWSDEGSFVNLQHKHNFTMAHFGMMLGMMCQSLQDLHVQHCNDFFSVGNGAWSAISCVKSLRRLAIEDLHCRLDADSLQELATMPQLEELSITGEQSNDNWHVGLDCIPEEWAALTNLTKLELRGHSLLNVLPAFLAQLPLRHLDLGSCRHLNLAVIPTLIQLEVLSLSATGLAEHRDSGAPAPSAAAIRMHLPDLSRLSRLTALNLSDNRLTRVPPMIGKLKQLKMLDLSCNQELQVASPLTTLQALPAIKLVDLRGVHEEPDVGYWTEAKCISMKHIAAFTKKMKQRPYGCKIMMDRD